MQIMVKLTVLALLILLVGEIYSAAPKKCLFPSFETNQTTDGLTNCRCAPGLEYDENYGICFKNQCKALCGDMQCQIRKPNIVNFSYLCYCDANYVPITPRANIGCTPFEGSSGFKEIGKRLPKNPLFLKTLKCNQTYELVGDSYECSCFPGYAMKESTGECVAKRKCTKTCGKNQICTVDDQNKSHCTCKTGRGLILIVCFFYC